MFEENDAGKIEQPEQRIEPPEEEPEIPGGELSETPIEESGEAPPEKPPHRVFNRKNFALAFKVLLFLFFMTPFLFLSARFFHISLSRMGVFYELEFQEGDMALACHRFLKGLPLYPDPEKGFIHLTYPPVQDVLTSLAMAITGSRKIWVGRFVSFLSTMGIVVLLFLWVMRETRSVAGAILAPLVFLSYYPMTGYWYDIFRPDSAFLFFCLLGSYLLTWKKPGREGIMWGIAGALVFTIAAYTKQSAVLLGGVAFLVHVILYRNWTPLVTAVVGIVSSLLILLYFYQTNPFFHVQCIQILLEHFKNLQNWKGRLYQELIRYTLAPFAAIIAWHVMSLFEKRWRSLIQLLLFASATYAGLRGLFKIGGYKNNYYPIAVFLALGLGWALGNVLEGRKRDTPWKYVQLVIQTGVIVLSWCFMKRILRFPAVSVPSLIFLLLWISMTLRCLIPDEKRKWRWLYGGAFCLFLFLWGAYLCHQFRALTPVKVNQKWKLVTRYPSELKIPPPAIVKGSQRVIDKIRELPGSVYMPHHNYYSWLAGKETFYSVDAVRDLTLGRGTGVIPKNLKLAIHERRFDFIILNNIISHDWLDDPIRRLIQKNYNQVENIEKMGWKFLRPVDETGMKPRYIWRRKDWTGE